MEIDPDEGSRAVLARIDALRADPPPSAPTTAGLVAALGKRWRLDVPVSVADFPRRFGKRVKAAGGSYSECRGHMQTRFVDLPGDAIGLADEIIAEACAQRPRRDGTEKRPKITVVAEGSPAPFDLGNASSWVRVHQVRSMSEALSGLTRAVESAITRGCVTRNEWS